MASIVPTAGGRFGIKSGGKIYGDYGSKKEARGAMKAGAKKAGVKAPKAKAVKGGGGDAEA